MNTPPLSPEPVPAKRAAPDVRWSGLTHVGRVRTNNEDVFLALAVDGHEVRYLGKTGRASLGGSDFVFAVSDGMGGAKSGEFASRITVDRVTRLFPRAFRLSAAGMGMGFADVLGELINEIHADLTRLGRGREGGFPTDELRRVIDGRQVPRGHGGSQMPIWGIAFQVPGQDANQEREVRTRIDQLVDYLRSIQR